MWFFVDSSEFDFFLAYLAPPPPPQRASAQNTVGLGSSPQCLFKTWAISDEIPGESQSQHAVCICLWGQRRDPVCACLHSPPQRKGEVVCALQLLSHTCEHHEEGQGCPVECGTWQSPQGCEVGEQTAVLLSHCLMPFSCDFLDIAVRLQVPSEPWERSRAPCGASAAEVSIQKAH